MSDPTVSESTVVTDAEDAPDGLGFAGFPGPDASATPWAWSWPPWLFPRQWPWWPTPEPRPTPEPPKTRRGVVSGRYRASGGSVEVELRVDVDGTGATNRVSADYFQRNGSTLVYVNSMRVDTLSVSTQASGGVAITGTGRFRHPVTATAVTIEVDRPVVAGDHPATATLRHSTPSGQTGASYVCTYLSEAFRTVLFEEALEANVADPFTSYDTGALPSGGAARTLALTSAYAEAGVELRSTGAMGSVPAPAGANNTWSDAELHAAMQARFSAWANAPQWAVWLLHASLHDLGTGLLGIMFDQQGRQRQGSAVFYAGLAGTGDLERRTQLYTCVHEVGHAFNLLHSWQKALATPPGINRPNSPSWMNYPWRFPAGQASFWNQFGFRFDTEELVHIRHGFRDAVIMGGDAFATNAQVLVPEPGTAPPSLRLDVLAPEELRWGTPLTVGLRLVNAGGGSEPFHRYLGPRNGSVDVLVERSDGRTVQFQPLLHHCVDESQFTVLTPGEELADTAFVQYGGHGTTIDQPGTYRVHARLTTATGDVVVADPAAMTVCAPADAADLAAGTALVDARVGTLLSLVGSDEPSLEPGREKLRQLAEEHPEHPLAQIGALVEAANLARGFTAVEEGEAVLRAPDSSSATAMASSVGMELKGRSALLKAKTSGDEAVDAYIASRRRELEVALG
jgi:hypothetical protein